MEKKYPKDYPEHLCGTSGATNNAGGNTRSSKKKEGAIRPRAATVSGWSFTQQTARL